MLRKIYISIFFLVCEGLSYDNIGVARGTTIFQEIRPGPGFKTGGFVKKSGRLP